MADPNDRQWTPAQIEEATRDAQPLAVPKLPPRVGNHQSSIIIRPAVQKQMDDEARREEYRRLEFTQPDWHSAEAKEAWRERKPINRSGILLPLKDSDWWAIGYDAAMAQIESRGDFDANGW